MAKNKTGFSTNLKRLRNLKRDTQQSLSEKINVSRPMIGSYEEGRCKPSHETLIVMADYFGVTVDELIRD